MLYGFNFIMFKTLIILYALNFGVIECTPKVGHSRTGRRPCLGMPRPELDINLTESTPKYLCSGTRTAVEARQVD